MRAVYLFVLVIAVMNLVLSAAVYGKHSKLGSQAQKVCTTGGCDAVLGSSYASFLGIPQALVGLVGFTFLALLAWYAWVFQHRGAGWVLTLLLVGGSLYALWLLYVQAFILGAFCPYCVVIDSAMIAATALLLYVRKKRGGHVFAAETDPV